MTIVPLSNLLELAVYNKAFANTTLWNSVSGRFKHGRPVAGWTTPYVIYSFGPLPGVNAFSENSPTTTPVSIFFSVFSTSEFSGESTTIAGYIEDVFNGGNLTLSGYTDMIVKLTGERPIEEKDTGMWHLMLTYSGFACPT